MRTWILLVSIFVSCFAMAQETKYKFNDNYTHGADDIKIHYVSLGEKGQPLMLFIHGFPDFWYTWSDLMKSFSSGYYTVAIDQRGYNLSDKPKAEGAYQMSKLVGDVVAVIHSLGYENAIVVGHDWGGEVAWEVGMQHPEMVDKLIILNLPHFNGLSRELATNPAQQKASEYARNFQNIPDICDNLSPSFLASIVIKDQSDTERLKKYTDAMALSYCEGMINYYKNYPSEPYENKLDTIVKVRAPVLLIHGLKDKYLLAGALNNTWDWVSNDLTIFTIPNAGHFVHHDTPEKVINTMKFWLALYTKE